MLFTPNTIEVNKVVKTISKIDKIKNVHIWQLNEKEVHLEAHIHFDEDIKLSEFDAILEIIEEKVFHNYGIHHVSIQPEFGKCVSRSLIVQD